MHMANTPSQRTYVEQCFAVLFILALHAVIFWIAKPMLKQAELKEVRYLSLFDVSKVIKPHTEPAKPPIKNDPRKITKSTFIAPETLSAKPESYLSKAPQSAAIEIFEPSLNIENLHGQAMKNERSRPVSDIKKLQASQKLNLSIEARLDRELNRIELPECRAALLGKPMIERMMIIQDHNRQKFCR